VTGKELRAKRKAAGIRQQDLADALGLHWTSISRMERGEWKISKSMAIAAVCVLTHKNKAPPKKRS
jgi:transcriptional regulator with XRE-family HTH domain